jgi:hypothetical protein
MRGAKQDPYSQEKLILQVLKRGGEFFELELGRIITGEYSRGSRSLIHVLRENGHPIASRNAINPITKRLNKVYYYEYDSGKYMSWALKNGYFNFKPGAPTV